MAYWKLQLEHFLRDCSGPIMAAFGAILLILSQINGWDGKWSVIGCGMIGSGVLVIIILASFSDIGGPADFDGGGFDSGGDGD